METIIPTFIDLNHWGYRNLIPNFVGRNIALPELPAARSNEWIPGLAPTERRRAILKLELRNPEFNSVTTARKETYNW